MFIPSATLDHEAMLQDSWARCRAFGLHHGCAAHFDPWTGERLQRWLARHAHLVATACREVLPYYENILGNSSCLIRLADGQGRLLKRWGEQRLAEPPGCAGFEPGACWAERHVGTNAIGTALACGQAVHIEHDEHFLKANRFMSGSASPIFDEQRCIVGVLDVSSDSYLPPSHTLGMVRMMSQSVENRLIRDACADRHALLTFNTGPSNLDSPWAGLLALDAHGRVVAANRRADSLLAQALPGTSVERLFKQPLAALLDHGNGATFTLVAAGRNRFQCRLQLPAQGLPASIATGSPALPATALDPAVAKALKVGKRLLDKDVGLLICGETGAGKEWLVRALHQASERHHCPLVAVNCAAIPMELVESELFGYERGAFTGARATGNIGLVRKAHTGILLLDEIADMPLATQARLLRVLQERAIQPLGAGDPVPVDIRVICATHQDLRQRVNSGHFRQDLYYRIAGATLNMPPLRQRSDKLELIQALLAPLHTPGEPQRPLSPAALKVLLRHPWPGNIRQLQSVLTVAHALAEGPHIEVCDLPEAFLDELQGLPAALSAPAATLDLGELLRDSDGNISQLARRLGVSRNTLYKRLRAHKTER